MGRGRTNKRKGSDAERYFAKFFRKAGFTFCKTARLASRLLDNCKIDLAFIPFNVQVKGGIHKGLNPHKVLKNMRKLLKENIPPYDPVHTYPLLVIHRRRIYAKSNDDDLLYMSLKQLKELDIKELKDYEIIEYKKIKGEYRKLVKMKFLQFKKHILPLYKNYTNGQSI